MPGLYGLYNKTVVGLFRYLITQKLKTSPDEIIDIPSRDPGRTIRAHLYRSTKNSNTGNSSATTGSPHPVLINFHGSGWILHHHGDDEEFCKRVANETAYDVLDVSYRLAPENPFPAAPHDAEDAVRWVLAAEQQSSRFDSKDLAVCGFSAGGNLALGLCSHTFPAETFSQVVAFYPVVDVTISPYSKVAPDTSGSPIPGFIAAAFNYAYDPLDGTPSSRAADPLMSPGLNDPNKFTRRLTMITCGTDNLCPEAEQLAARIASLPGRDVVVQRMEKCDHGWDKRAVEGTHQGHKKKEAYDLVIRRLNGAN